MHEVQSDGWNDEPLEVNALRDRLAQIGIKVSSPTLYRWAQNGLIPTTKLGRYRSTVRAVVNAMTPSSAPITKKTKKV